MVSPFFGPKIGEDQKQGLRRKSSGLLVQMKLVIVNFYFWLTRATFKDGKSTLPNQKKGNNDKTIYVETCTISSFINNTQKAMTMHGR